MIQAHLRMTAAIAITDLKLIAGLSQLRRQSCSLQMARSQGQPPRLTAVIGHPWQQINDPVALVVREAGAGVGAPGLGATAFGLAVSVRV